MFRSFKKDVTLVVEKLNELMCHDLGKKGPGVFNFAGMLKVLKVHKPATKAVWYQPIH